MTIDQKEEPVSGAFPMNKVLFRDDSLFEVLNIFFKRYPLSVMKCHIHEKKGLQRSNIYRALKKLAHLGLIKTLLDVKDKRKNVYELSEEGKSFLNNFINFSQNKSLNKGSTTLRISITFNKGSNFYDKLLADALLQKRVRYYISTHFESILQKAEKMKIPK